MTSGAPPVRQPLRGGAPLRVCTVAEARAVDPTAQTGDCYPCGLPNVRGRYRQRDAGCVVVAVSVEHALEMIHGEVDEDIALALRVRRVRRGR